MDFGNILDNAVLVDHFRKMGVTDYVAFLTVEPGGKGICINAGQVSERSFDVRTRQVWSRVSAHVAAARRLREALVAADAAPVEAMMTPTGKLEHAEGEGKSTTARAVLREAVRRQERARGRLRRDDPEQATEAWTALVSGRWSLVDHYERGGRRYIAARRNEHTLADPRALTPRERVVVQLAALGKSNKLIAYEIGLSPSTVATHISAAMRKLRVKSRVELIELARQLGGA
jgi:DNA-binding CsgD family transcriptional regulator